MIRAISNVFLRMLAIAGSLVMCSAVMADPITVTDTLGRTITIEKPVKRIVLGQGRYIPVIGLIHPDPVSVVVGAREDFQRDTATYAYYRSRFPAIEKIASVGGAASTDFSIEATIALKPDLVVLSYYAGREAGGDARFQQLVDTLGKAGIPVIALDFFVHPLENSMQSLRILGKVLGRGEEAERFAKFYEDRLKRIRDRVETGSVTRPNVFMHVHAGGMPCCLTAAKGVFDDFIRAAGGNNLARDALPGITGQLSLEYLIKADPDIYIATGGAHMARTGGLVLGTMTSPETARSTFDNLINSKGLRDLTAVRNGKAFGVWHLFNDSPVHLVLVELMAKKFHPDLFPDIDPQATLDQIGRDFSAVPFEGVYWIDGRP